MQTKCSDSTYTSALYIIYLAYLFVIDLLITSFSHFLANSVYFAKR